MSTLTKEFAALETGTATVHGLFEEQADQRPTATALVFGDEQISYQELDERANQLAHYLRSLGVGPGELVGLYLERSEKAIIAILAILKAGGGYIPIDPTHPWERVKHILDEAKVSVMITASELPEESEAFFHGTVVDWDNDRKKIARQSTERISADESGVSPGDICYVLYTSGSTGRPKGVMTEHRNVVRFVRSFNEIVQLDSDDRVYQGFALGFDGSVEEMWMAFSNGARLVVGPPEAARVGSEVARVFREQQITVFSTVPTFLSLIQEELPSVRLIIVSGEACPPEAVQRWAIPSRRMLNVYGPTETTVNSTAKLCTPGEPVTIGRPLRGYTMHILDEQQRPVPRGEAGELYIGGVGLARGYLNQPELTQKQFVPNCLGDKASGPRLYKTGDLVKWDEDGELLFLGRIDRQVKVRGFRIELSEIESVLREHDMIHQAVVTVVERDGLKHLAAHVTSPCNGSFDRDDVRDSLRERLPVYMVPSFLDVLPELPMLDSGKVDRKKLPEPALPLVASKRTIVEAESETERRIVEVWKDLCKTPTVSVEDDFFMDLGGYSLLAGQTITALRNDHGFDVAIRDLYKHTTARRLARYIEDHAQACPAVETTAGDTERRSAREVFHSVPRLTRWSVYVLQLISLIAINGLQMLPLLIVALLGVEVYYGGLAFGQFLTIVFVMVFAAPPLGILLTIATKWLLIGRFKAGEYPLWTFYYFRWWLVTRMQEMSWIELYTGTPIVSLYFRLMGARVGKNCLLDTTEALAFDLLTIGDDTCIGTQTQLTGYRVEDGLLKIGTIEVGSRCFIGTHCCLDINSKMGDDTCLDDLSLLPTGEAVPDGESRRGSPAAAAVVSVPRVNEERAAQRHPFWWGLAFFIAGEIVGEMVLLTTLPPLAIIYGCFLWGGISGAVAGVFLSIPIGLVAFCLMIATYKAIIMRKAKPGVYSTESWFYLRKWSADLLLTIAGRALKGVYTTIFLPTWLRMLGAKIGKWAEIATVSEVSPDLITIGEGSFFADGSMVGGRRLFRGHVQLARNKVGNHSFVGNNALLPMGASLGDNCLLGVISTPPGGVGATTPDTTEWLGSPAFQLPNRKKVGGFADEETFNPTLKLCLIRTCIDTLRILIPYFIWASGMLLFITAAVAGYFYLPLWAVFALLPLVSSAVAVGSALSVVLLKWVVMGTFKPVIKPLWCVWIWTNEMMMGSFETVVQGVVESWQGTPYACWFMRLMGCKIGKHVYLESILFSEFDLVEIGDYAALNLGSIGQTHLFEDRIFKSSYVKIGAECSVGNMTVVLYDTEMKDGSSIGSLSLLMKGETLAADTRCIGIPMREIK